MKLGGAIWLMYGNNRCVPDYQNKGVPTLVICDLIETYRKLGFRYAETNANLETNTAVQALWTPFEKEQHKKRWVFGKEI